MLRPDRIVAELAKGSRQVLNIAVTTAAAGIIVGVVIKDVRIALAADPLPMETVRELLATA